MLIDSHCHLNDDALKNRIDSLLLNARQNGVDYMLSACSDINEFDDILNIIKAHNNIFGSIAQHPFEIKDDLKINYMIDFMNESIKKNRDKILCVGECGLDYFYNPDISEKNRQIDFFAAQLNIALNYSLPVMVHTRMATDDTYKLLKDFVNKGGTGVIHCFTGNKSDAERYLSLGFYLSASGIITFKKSDELRDAFSYTPIEKILIETDAPYLAPVPMRGKTNEPAFISYTAKVLSEIKNTSISNIENTTTINFQNLYQIDLTK